MYLGVNPETVSAKQILPILEELPITCPAKNTLKILNGQILLPLSNDLSKWSTHVQYNYQLSQKFDLCLAHKAVLKANTWL